MSGPRLAAMAASTTAYTSYVSKIPGRSNMPDEASSNPHHVANGRGKITGFRNPYPSWRAPAVFTHLLW
jgi:N-acyl-phosphatidylethanolamine-hydrolysing phospholipase D